ncbi:hypothetical protein QEN19_002346 [Hanseniaspora menglaensis]
MSSYMNQSQPMLSLRQQKEDAKIEEMIKDLLRFVARAFFSSPYILVLDCILFHSVLAEEDISHLLGLKRPDIRSLCSKLIEERLLSSHSQPEFQAGTKGVRRYYYFIKYPEAIDAIKWKVHQLVTKLKLDLQENSKPQGYLCATCNTKYSQLDAVSLLNYDRTQFICSLCDHPLVEDDSGKLSQVKQQNLSRLMVQLEPIITYLKKIDDAKVEENTFELALTKLIPPQNNTQAYYSINAKQKRRQDFVIQKLREQTLSQAAQQALAQSGADLQAQANAVNGILNNNSSRKAGTNSQATLHVNITTASDEKAQKELQIKQYEEKMKHNALPEWHEQSTIGKSLGHLKDEEGSSNNNLSGIAYNNNNNAYVSKNVDHYRKADAELEQRRELDDYYNNLQKQQAVADSGYDSAAVSQEPEGEDIDEFGEFDYDALENEDENINDSHVFEGLDDDDFEDDEEFEDIESSVVPEKETQDKSPVLSESLPEESKEAGNEEEEDDDDDNFDFEDV